MEEKEEVIAKPKKKLNKKQKIAIIVSVVLVVAILGTTAGILLPRLAFKPGYKEVWEPVADYQYLEAELNKETLDSDIATVTDRVKAYRIEQERDRAKKFIEDQNMATEPVEDTMSPIYLNKHLDANGIFDNIDYDSTSKSYWKPIDHLTYLVQLQIAYNDDKSPLFHDDDMKGRIVKAMNYFVDNRGDKDGKMPDGSNALFYCTWNGWYNNIGIGMRIPDIMLFGLEGMSTEKQDKLLSQISSTLLQNSKLRFKIYERKVNEGGGNLTDQVLSTMKVALLEKDGVTLYWLKTLLENELRPFPPYKGYKYHRWDAEGPKEDYSFQQHDQLIYYGGYGEVMMDGLTRYLSFTRNTQFQLNDKALNFYADFLAEGMQFAVRNGYRDISASGRGIARQNGLKGIMPQLKLTVDMLLSYDGDPNGTANIGDEQIAKLVKMRDERFGEVDKGADGHRYFYESDYHAMNNKNYMATVRSASNRTRIFEYLNGENPLAYYTGMGATFFYVDGAEYYNTLPSYNWNRIPGTTTRQGIQPKMNQDLSYGTYGNNKYVMGVSNGNVGLSYMRLSDKGVSAKKSYFMFEDGVVCLGSDIDSMLSKDVFTTIDQARWDNDIILGSGSEVKTIKRDASATDYKANKLEGVFDYVYHDHIAYISKNNLEVNADQNVAGDWKTIDERGASRPVKNDIYNLGINHGRRFINKDYAYTVLMGSGITPDSTKAYVQDPYLKVVANKGNVQAVYDSKNDVLEAVFHKGSKLTLPDGSELKLNKGAVLIMEKNSEGKIVMTIASNDYEEETVNIKLGSVEKQVSISKRPLKVEF